MNRFLLVALFAVAAQQSRGESAFEQLYADAALGTSELVRSGNTVYAIRTGEPPEKNRIHIYDVTNPANPVHRGFWRMDDVRLGPASVVGNRLIMAGEYGINIYGCLLVFDISDPTTMTLKKIAVHNESRLYRDIEIYRGYAYVSDIGFDVWSLANIDDPKYVMTQKENAGGGVVGLDAENDCLYLTTGHVFSISTPSSPKHLFYKDFYAQYGSCRSIAVVGDVVYAGCGFTNTDLLVSFRRSGNSLIELSRIVVGGTPGCISVSGDFLYCSGINFLESVDIRRPESMRKLDKTPAYWASGTSIDGNIVYATSPSDGFRVWKYNGKLYNAAQSWTGYE